MDLQEQKDYSNSDLQQICCLFEQCPSCESYNISESLNVNRCYCCGIAWVAGNSEK